MARTANAARKESQRNSARKEVQKTSFDRSTRSLSVKTPVISQLEKPVKSKKGTTGNILNEIKYYQNNIGFLIPKAAVVRLIKENVPANLRSRTSETMKFTSVSLNIIHESLENYLTCLLDLSYMASRHAKRVTLFPSDIRLIKRINKKY